MLKDNNNKNKFNILIIDSDTDFSGEIKARLKDIGYRSIQVFGLKNIEKDINNFKNSLDLIILDIESGKNNPLLKYIQKNTDAKIIILNELEDSINRDDYFMQGILDFYLKSNNINYIVDDISESINRLELNKKENILVIDDSKVICYLIKSLLENKNYNIFTALNAKDGLKIIEKENLSLLILDMELPDMHGIGVMDKLRDIGSLNNFPILVVSGSNNPSTIRKVLKKGASDFLNKPFLYEEFLLKIDLLIKSSRSQQTLKIQKKQIEETLDSFEALVNSIIEALLIFEKNICTEVNDVAIKLLGYSSKNDLLGKNIFEIFNTLSQEHKELIIDDAIEHNFESNLDTTDGSLLQVQIKERNINLGVRVLKIIAIMDITQIKQKELMLNNQSKMASMGEMIGNIAHQWRQPLTAISIAAGGIKLGYELDINDEEDVLRELDNIVENSQFLSETIEDFQNFLKNDRLSTNFSARESIDKTIAIINANLKYYEIDIVKDYDKNIQINGIQNDLI
ncbi:MAG: response regulator, partial [Campylobacterota bacterium]|nr:response regulator [Campylobacterota bacterium]